MKKILLSLTIVICFFAASAQETKSNDGILGIWKTGTGNGKVEIYKKGNQFLGKIVWLSEPIDPKTGKAKTDVMHPDKTLHNRSILGLINLWGFSYDGDNKWDGGHIYDPKNGKEYKCTITLKDKNTLSVRGFIGISMIGRTDVWQRSSL
jgi:uncharacterized protein (DUF2147 family)